VVLVAALEPGAGTSVTASNLAFVAAKAGRSVLLIDGNSDRPSLAALVPAGAQANLINLQGTYRPIYRVQGQSAPLDLVPMMPDEEELCFRIAQQRAYEPIEGMNGRYDFVVIDGPVLNGGDEDRELAAVADRVLLVVPDASKSRVSVDDLIYDLDINKAKFAGVVVTFPGRSAP
jgi:cellulose biosynthesis protein BcsQ